MQACHPYTTALRCHHYIPSVCLNVKLQVLDGELGEKYKQAENVIAKKSQESADARRKAEMLQNEAKTLLAQANSKLQLLKGGSLHLGSCFCRAGFT